MSDTRWPLEGVRHMVEAAEAKMAHDFPITDAMRGTQDGNKCAADEIEQLKVALSDAINSPKGVVPDSAEPFYDGQLGRVR